MAETTVFKGNITRKNIKTTVNEFGCVISLESIAGKPREFLGSGVTEELAKKHAVQTLLRKGIITQEITL